MMAHPISNDRGDVLLDPWLFYLTPLTMRMFYLFLLLVFGGFVFSGVLMSFVTDAGSRQASDELRTATLPGSSMRQTVELRCHLESYILSVN